MKPISKRIITATFYSNPKLTVTCIYAPTDCAPDDKAKFYNNLEDHLEHVKIHNIHLVVGDFNARVGSDSHLAHPEVIAHHCFYDTTRGGHIWTFFPNST